MNQNVEPKTFLLKGEVTLYYQNNRVLSNQEKELSVASTLQEKHPKAEMKLIMNQSNVVIKQPGIDQNITHLVS